MVRLPYPQVMIWLTRILSCVGAPPATSVCTYCLRRVTELTQWHLRQILWDCFEFRC